jgi:hypothetical protein
MDVRMGTLARLQRVDTLAILQFGSRLAPQVPTLDSMTGTSSRTHARSSTLEGPTSMSHTHVAPSRHLMWLPAALLIAAALLAATGLLQVPGSQAATATTTVGATVNKEVHVALNDAGLCGAISGSTVTKSITGTTLNVTDGDVSLATCRLTFGSNNSALGANLLVESTRVAGTNSFCTQAATVACAAPQFTEAATGGVAPATFAVGEPAAAGFFGIRANINGGTCAGGMGASVNYFGLGQNTDATPNGATVCSTSSTTDGDVTIDYRTNPGSAQPASTSYLVQTTFTATAI